MLRQNCPKDWPRSKLSTVPNPTGQSIRQFLLIGALSLLPSWAFSAHIQLDSGDTFSLGSGTLDLGCGNFILQDNAVFNAGSGQINLSGDWSNEGTFNRGDSSVSFNDDCGSATVSTVSGETDFHNLTVTTAASHEMHFESGSQQSTANALVLTGADGNLLNIRSTQPGTPALFMLDEGGSQTVDYVDVQDNHGVVPGQWLAPNTPEHFNSVDSGGNRRWFLNGIGAQSIPALSGIGLVILALMILIPAYWQRRGS